MRSATLCTMLGLACALGAQDRTKPLEPTAKDAAPLLGEEGEQALRASAAVRAVQRAADSVVSIYVVHPNRLSRAGGEDLALDGQGSGVILDESGLVITNWHVVMLLERGEQFQLQLRLKSGKSYAADLLSTSPEWDLALLQLRLPEGEKVKPVTLGDSDTLMVGEDLLAIGNPQGNANTVSKGILSATLREIRVRTPDGQVRRYTGLLQTDAAINPGNSGGALLDITGKLMGINNAMAQGAENIGFAIPVNTMKKVFQDVLLSAENLASVWLGIKVKDQEGKPVITEVHPAGPAADVGLREGDVVVSTEGKQVGSALDFRRRTVGVRAGQPLAIVVERRSREVTATLKPWTNTAYEVLRKLGAELEDVSAAQDREYVRRVTRRFYENAGYRGYPQLPAVLRVRRVHPDSPAAALDLRENDVLLAAVGTDYWGRVTRRVFQSSEDLLNVLRMVGKEKVQVEALRGEEIFEGELVVRR